MSNKLIDKLQKEGRIRKQRAGFTQVEDLLRQAILDLKEAKKIANIAERATYLLAYMAMLKAGRALLLLKGYAPTGVGQHKTIVEITTSILGTRYQNLTNQFDTMRRKRHKITYEAGMLLSRSETQKAFSDSISLVQKILEEIRTQNPQLKLKLEL
jgi:uncharacterized protein (UPF0332 family)